MAKDKTPFMSFSSKGSVGKIITTQKMGSSTLVRKKPIPTDRKTDFQLWHRYLYRQACQYWQTITSAQKTVWETNARPYHMTGFAYFMRFELNRLANLVLAYPLDENTGSTAADFSGNLNHGIIYGASWAAGRINSCLSFDGVDNYINCGNKPSLALITAAFTFEAWLYMAVLPSAVGKHLCIMAKSGPVLRNWIRTNDKHTWYGKIGGVTYYKGADTALAKETWYHLAITYSGSYFQFYQGGDPDGGFACSGDLDTNALDLLIGTLTSGNQAFHGLIDEPRLYNICLPAGEIKRHSDRR